MIRHALDRTRTARRDDSGFTLIELLIVIVILGVLAGIVVFSVRGINNNSKSAACKTEYRTVETAVEAYYAQNNAYPGTADPLQKLVDDGFLKSKPTDWVTGVNSTTGVVSGTACPS